MYGQHRVERGLGVEREPDPQPELTHALEQRAGIAELDVDRAAVGAGRGEVVEEDAGVVDHEVAVEVQLGPLAQRLHDRRPDREDRARSGRP